MILSLNAIVVLHHWSPAVMYPITHPINTPYHDSHTASLFPHAPSGRHRVVVGVFLVVKPRGGLPFSHEDVVAAEMVAAAGAIGLYWCRGLGRCILDSHTLRHMLIPPST